MPLNIPKLFNVKIFGTNPQICPFVYENFQWLKTIYIDPLPDIELPVVYQTRPLDIFLYHFRAHRPVILTAHIRVFHLVKAENTNSSSVIAWFANPHVVFSVYLRILS